MPLLVNFWTFFHVEAPMMQLANSCRSKSPPFLGTVNRQLRCSSVQNLARFPQGFFELRLLLAVDFVTLLLKDVEMRLTARLVE